MPEREVVHGVVHLPLVDELPLLPREAAGAQQLVLALANTQDEVWIALSIGVLGMMSFPTLSAIKSNNSADKDLSLSFFAHLIFIRKNEVITHLFPLENLESSPFA